VAKRTQQQKHLQFVWSADGKAIFASGVGQPDVKHGSGTIASRQANNMLIYPGLSPYNFSSVHEQHACTAVVNT
jgi:hypothetical protein